MKNFCLTILLALVFSVSFAQKDSLVINEEVLDPIQTSEIRAYQLLYENSNEINNKILSTIYWSLGGIFTVVLAIIGSTIFFNFRFNKKEIENITTDAIRQIDIAKNTFSNQIEEKLNNFIIETQKSLNIEEQNLTNTYKELLKSYSDNLESQIKANKEFFSEKIIQIENKIEFNLQSTVEKTNELNNSLIKRIKEKEIKSLNNEAELWKLRGVPSNALRCHIKECSLGFDVGFFWLFEMRLDRICAEIDKIDELDKYLKEEIDDFMLRIPSSLNAEKSELSKALKKFN
ncbi:hypothetical protein AB1A65_00755 [Muricauda sp. ANG21]|uniref:hypothetical protein n=1 Tax=Allomuricauda sp. ANG21 TaxID=3042468 RepID=UPI003453E2ED